MANSTYSGKKQAQLFLLNEIGTQMASSNNSWDTIVIRVDKAATVILIWKDVIFFQGGCKLLQMFRESTELQMWCLQTHKNI